MARGREERRILETIQQSLPEGYVADVIWFTRGTPAGNGRHRDQETRLYVQRSDLAGTRQTIAGVPQTQLLADIDRQLEAEKTRIRGEYPGWRHNSDPPNDPGN
jgi:LmbE family N-acetylglucosaminyl deacetylase